MLLKFPVTTYDRRSGKKVAMQQIGCFLVRFEVVARWSLIFQVGAGNFGGPRTSANEKKGAVIPKRPADKIIVEQTSEGQAALYRVGSGDMSLLHIDARVAAVSDLWSLMTHFFKLRIPASRRPFCMVYARWDSLRGMWSRRLRIMTLPPSRLSR